MYAVALALWGVFLLGAVVYTRQARHPRMRPVAAFLIFTIVFTTISFSIFAALTIVAQALQLERLLADPLVAAVFLTVVFGPAFFIARWQLQRPPRPQWRL